MIDSENKEINNEKIILVDLMLKGGNLLIRPIMVAKFLQQYYGYKIVGLVGTTDIIRAITPIEHSETVQILARSYDITEFICVDTPSDEDFSIRVSMQDKYSELSAFDLADEIEGCSEDEAKERISFLDRYPMDIGLEDWGPDVQKMNIDRLYDLFQGEEAG